MYEQDHLALSNNAFHKTYGAISKNLIIYHMFELIPELPNRVEIEK